MGKKRKKRNDFFNINLIEKLGVLFAFLSTAERIIIMILFEG